MLQSESNNNKCEMNQKSSDTIELNSIIARGFQRIDATNPYDDGRIQSLQDIRLFVFLFVSFMFIAGMFVVSDYFAHSEYNSPTIYSVTNDISIINEN